MEATVNAVSNAAKRAVNAFATDNFTTSGASGLYHRARPTYPQEAVQKLVSVLNGKKDAHIVEVGAGTGLFTERLVEATEGKGQVSRITAIEPSSGMREGFLRSALLQPDRSTPPLVDVKDGSFADLPFESSSADIIVGAQCWHWAHPDYGQAIAEFARVLKPGGTLAFIWNLEDRDTDWVAKVRDTYEAYEKGTPQYRLGWWKETFKTAEYKQNFAEAEQHDYVVKHPTTEQGVVDRALSKSYVTAQPPEEQAKVDQGIRNVLKTAQGRVWIDESAGSFEYPYRTSLYLMRKLA